MKFQRFKLFWWRWRESNSRPKAFPLDFLRAQLMNRFSPWQPLISRLLPQLSR
nr:MAG TPA: hypothetical protein [Caudoviricetes sp.]